MSDLGAIREALAAPFAPEEVRFKAQAVKGNRCLAVSYVDARVVMDRLDDVLGIDGWQDSYTVLPGGEVQVHLQARLAGAWVYHEDVGAESEQPDDGDKCKAAFSDALKRVAVKLGVGRYLYRLGSQWVDYDPQKRQITDGALRELRASLAGKGPQRQSGPVAATAQRSVAAVLRGKQRWAEKIGLAGPSELVNFVLAGLEGFRGTVDELPESYRDVVDSLIADYKRVATTACGPVKAVELVSALQRKGRNLAELNLALGKPQGTQPADYSERDFARAMALLSQHEDMPARKRGA